MNGVIFFPRKAAKPVKRKVVDDSDSEFEVEKKKPRVSSEDLFDSMMSNKSTPSPPKKGNLYCLLLCIEK